MSLLLSILLLPTLLMAQVYSARTDVALVPYPGTIPCPSSGGCSGGGALTGANYSFTPSDFPYTAIRRLTDNSTDLSGHNWNTSCDSGSEVNDFSKNNDRMMLCESGQHQVLFGLDTSTTPPTATKSAFAYLGTGSFYFSYAQPYLMYHAHANASQDLAIFSYDVTCGSGIATCNPSGTQVIDLGTTCSIAALTGNANATTTEGLTVSGDDQTFLVLGSTTSSQGAAGAQYAIAWNRTTGCTWWNTGTGHWFSGATDEGTVSIGDAFYMHNLRIGKGGTWAKVSMQSGTCQSTCQSAFNYFWEIGNATVNVSLTTSNGCGHTAIGYSNFVNKCNTLHNVNDMLIAPFTAINSNVSLPSAFPSPDVSNGAHVSWADDNSSDTAPFFAIMEAAQFAPVDGWDNVILAVATDGSGKVWQLLHTYATPATSPFVAASISQDGKYLAWTTDWDSMVGNTNGSGASCTAGTNCRTDVFLAQLPIGVPAPSAAFFAGNSILYGNGFAENWWMP